MELALAKLVKLAKICLGMLFPVLRLDSGVDLDTMVRILRKIAMPTAFYGMEVAIRDSEKARQTRQRVLVKRDLGEGGRS